MTLNKKLLIIGASGHGKVVADIAIKMNKWGNISFLDDDNSVKTCMGFEVIGKTADAIRYKEEADFFIAIGNNAMREKVQEKLMNSRLSMVTLIHPSAVIGTDVELGIGSIIMAGVVINSSTRIGKGCIINTSCCIDHDNAIGEYVHISPGANLAGTVKVGKSSWIGVGSVVSNNVNICDETTIGAGAVVLDDIYSGGVYVGIPARKIL